jgi:hypothetical protein
MGAMVGVVVKIVLRIWEPSMVVVLVSASCVSQINSQMCPLCQFSVRFDVFRDGW